MNQHAVADYSRFSKPLPYQLGLLLHMMVRDASSASCPHYAMVGSPNAQRFWVLISHLVYILYHKNFFVSTIGFYIPIMFGIVDVANGRILDRLHLLRSSLGLGLSGLFLSLQPGGEGWELVDVFAPLGIV